MDLTGVDMDRKQLNLAIQRFFGAYQFVRYQGCVFTVKSEIDFAVLCSQVEAILLEYDMWHKPGKSDAPGIPCGRRDFMDAVFLLRPRGLIITSPSEWMLDWPDQDQAIFWTGIADAFGRHPIVSLSLGTPSLTTALRLSLVEHALPGLPVSVWLSRHQPVDQLDGVLA